VLLFRPVDTTVSFFLRMAGGGLTLALVVVVTTVAAGPRDALVPGGTAIVTEVVDGDTVFLDDQRQVRLVGIQAPKLPLGRAGYKAWPFAEEAKVELEKLILGKRVELRYGGRRMDRHRRTLAHLFLDGGGWVQGRLLSTGLARVYTFADNRKLAAEMYGFERAARSRRLGIWSDGYYAIRNTDFAESDTGTFQVVEGRVFGAARVRSRVYLNFSSDWRTDFTVVVHAKDLQMFLSADMDPLSLAGKRVRVRGWIKKWNGPMIDLTHPEQLELLTEG
jgi:endonuclease YncB( thermonuclease family)